VILHTIVVIIILML